MTSSQTDLRAEGLAVRNPFAAAPLWALVAVAAGGVVAVQILPARGYYLPGDLAPAAAALTLGLLGGVVVAGLRSAVSLFRAENVLCFGLFYWLLLDLVLGAGAIGLVSADAISRSLVAITLFALALWAGSLLVGIFAGSARPVRASGIPDLRAGFLFGAALLCGVLGMARVVVGCRFSIGCIADAYYQPRFTAVWLQVDAFGPFDTLFMFSRYFGFVVLPLAVALINREGRFTWRAGVTLLLGLVCLVFMVADGGRRDVGTVVGASLLVWALMKQRVALRELGVIAVVAGTLVAVMQFMLVVRDIGAAAAFDRGLSVPITSWSRPLGTVDRNFRFLANIVQLVPERYPHNGWQGVAYAATLWIPGGFVPREWQRRTLDLPRELDLQVGPRYSWTCSAVGDLYLIGGLPAVIVGGLLFGALARGVSRFLRPSVSSGHAILYALLTMTLFLSLRALHEMFATGLIVLAFTALVYARRALRRRPVEALG
jgi:hypothetical protein